MGVQAGDVLFVPPGWGHAVRVLADALGLSTLGYRRDGAGQPLLHGMPLHRLLPACDGAADVARCEAELCPALMAHALGVERGGDIKSEFSFIAGARAE